MLPPATDAHCTYAADRIATMFRRPLTADPAERSALEDLVADVPLVEVVAVDVVVLE